MPAIAMFYQRYTMGNNQKAKRLKLQTTKQTKPSLKGYEYTLSNLQEKESRASEIILNKKPRQVRLSPKPLTKEHSAAVESWHWQGNFQTALSWLVALHLTQCQSSDAPQIKCYRLVINNLFVAWFHHLRYYLH